MQLPQVINERKYVCIFCSNISTHLGMYKQICCKVKLKLDSG